MEIPPTAGSTQSRTPARLRSPLTFLNGDGINAAAADPLRAAIEALRQGQILAIKGWAAFTSVWMQPMTARSAVAERKLREEKPLAIMVNDIEAAAAIALLNDKEKALLLSPQRPIVLVAKKEANLIAPSVAPGVFRSGHHAAYTPLQYLLLEKHFQCLVDDQRQQGRRTHLYQQPGSGYRLKGIADFFLVHDRDILSGATTALLRSNSGQDEHLQAVAGLHPGRWS